MFSIIVPIYNKSEFVGDTVNSILKQDYTDFELILVNDGSTDDSLAILQGFKDERIRIIDKTNGGVSSARNAGIESAKGEWITFFDADDMMYPYALSTYLSAINKYPDIKVIVAATDQSNKMYDSEGSMRLVTDYDMENAKSYAKSGFSLVNTDCICIHKTVLDKIGIFNQAYTHGEDMDLWKRISEKYHLVKIEKAVGLYVQDVANNSTSVNESKRKYAPIALLEYPRSELKNRSAKTIQGSRIFFHVLPNGIKKQPLDSIRLIFKYMDCLLLFILLIVKYRILKRV